MKHTIPKKPRSAPNIPTFDTNKPPKNLADETTRHKPVDIPFKHYPTALSKSRSAQTSPRGKRPSKSKISQSHHLHLPTITGNTSDDEANRRDTSHPEPINKIMCKDTTGAVYPHMAQDSVDSVINTLSSNASDTIFVSTKQFVANNKCFIYTCEPFLNMYFVTQVNARKIINKIF